MALSRCTNLHNRMRRVCTRKLINHDPRARKEISYVTVYVKFVNFLHTRPEIRLRGKSEGKPGASRTPSRSRRTRGFTIASRGDSREWRFRDPRAFSRDPRRPSAAHLLSRRITPTRFHAKSRGIAWAPRIAPGFQRLLHTYDCYQSGLLVSPMAFDGWQGAQGIRRSSVPRNRRFHLNYSRARTRSTLARVTYSLPFAFSLFSSPTSTPIGSEKGREKKISVIDI